MAKTTINNKEIEIYTKDNIKELFTDRVKEYLNNGYHFYFYSGSQGEITKVCLEKVKGEVIIIFADNFYNYSNEESGICIFVKKYVDVKDSGTLWLNKGEVIEEIRFYDISRYDTKEKFVQSIEEIKVIRELQHKRLEDSYVDSDITLPRSCVAPALKLLKKIHGYKSKKSSNIQKVYKGKAGYSIKLFNQCSRVPIGYRYAKVH